ncbi:MAG: hypothetical protein QOI85_1280 [Chloroflexota bacterium]|jgi:hypothetical protein|nr:hypothetical protein [Chloroflexota bacterium]
MTATAIREGARIAALIVVLVLAAVLGLVVGNALHGRSSAGVGAAAPEAAAIHGTHSYADPHYQLIRRAAAGNGADASSLRGTTPR